MTILIKYNIESKNIIKQIFTDTNMYVSQWLGETNETYCVILYKEDIPVVFALLHKMDFDPVGVHNTPVLLDFIYTFEQHRNKGYATKLVRKLKQNNQMTGFCSNDDSINLFKKCGFNITKGNCCRFPKSADDYKMDTCCSNIMKEVGESLIDNMLSTEDGFGDFLNLNINKSGNDFEREIHRNMFSEYFKQTVEREGDYGSIIQQMIQERNS